MKDAVQAICAVLLGVCAIATIIGTVAVSHQVGAVYIIPVITMFLFGVFTAVVVALND